MPPTCSTIDIVGPRERALHKNHRVSHAKVQNRRSPAATSSRSNGAKPKASSSNGLHQLSEAVARSQACCVPKSKAFYSPSRGSTPSPKLFEPAFAGSKFNDPPSPSSLPKPPSSWMAFAATSYQAELDSDATCSSNASDCSSDTDYSQDCLEMSNKLKILLNVRA